MTPAFTARRAATCLAAAGAVACAGTTDPKPDARPATTEIALESDAGDYIGAGRRYTYAPSNAVITVGAAGARLSVSVAGDEWWRGDFQLPSGEARLRTGTFTGLTRHPFHNSLRGGLDWSGEGRGCNTLTGELTIDDVAYQGDVLTAVDLRFRQHCEGMTPALRGTIRWRATDGGTPAGPGAIPVTLWRPPAGALPATGEYVYLQSDQGDYIGQGQTALLRPPTEPIRVSVTRGLAQVNVGGWRGEFQAMNSLDRLERGYYPSLQRYPFHNPARGGLSWAGNGRGCNTLGGWFVVDRVAYAGDALTALELRFEQRCENGTAALRGALRWGG